MANYLWPRAGRLDQDAWAHRHRECGPDCCITGDRCEDDRLSAAQLDSTVADLQPGQRVLIYGDVPATVVAVEPHHNYGAGWLRLRYRAEATGLEGIWVLAADRRLPLAD